MDEHLPGVSTRRDGRSCPAAEYSQMARRTVEYRLVGAGGRRDGEVQATGRRIGEGWCRWRQSNEGRKRGICDQIVGFACSLADRVGPFLLFSRPGPRARPGGSWMAWARRMDEDPNSKENEEPRVRLDRFSPSEYKNGPRNGRRGPYPGDALIYSSTER
jgi:hypothetical protein